MIDAPMPMTHCLTLCLKLIKEEREALKAMDLVTFELKLQAGLAASSSKYKKQVEKFGATMTPAHWIKTINALKEVWLQNGLMNVADKEAAIMTILRDKALTSYEASIEEQQNDGQGAALLALTNEMIQVALNAVSEIVFPN